MCSQVLAPTTCFLNGTGHESTWMGMGHADDVLDMFQSVISEHRFARALVSWGI